MASKHTEKYLLNQWEGSDQVVRTDFNEDNLKIEKALAGLAEELTEETAARERAVAGVTAGIPRIAVGSYAGNGAASRVISVGFTPKAVYVCVSTGLAYGQVSSGYVYGGLAVTGFPVSLVRSTTYPAVRIIGGGFTVYETFTDSYSGVKCNSTEYTYHYLAIG